MMHVRRAVVCLAQSPRRQIGQRVWSTTVAAHGLEPPVPPHRAAWEDGRPQDGVQLVREALARDPSSLELRKELLDMLVGVAAFEEAVDVATAILEQGGACAETQYQRGEARERLGRSAEAVADYEAAVALDPRHALARARLASLTGDPTMLDAAIAACADDGEARADLLYERGRLLFGHRALDEAMADFEQAIVANPRCAPAYFGRGDVLLLRDDDHIRAMHNYDRFWELHERYFAERPGLDRLGSFPHTALLDLLTKQAACYAGLQLWDSCLRTCNRVMELAVLPADAALVATAQFYAGRAHEGLRQPDDAMDHYERALALRPSLRAARLRLDALVAELRAAVDRKI